MDKKKARPPLSPLRPPLIIRLRGLLWGARVWMPPYQALSAGETMASVKARIVPGAALAVKRE